MALSTDKHMKIEKVGKVWRAQHDGITICSTKTKRGCEQNAEFLQTHMHPQLWAALVKEQRK